MRNRIQLVLALAVVVIVTGAMGSSTVLGLPPSSGTPTQVVGSFGTIVLATTFTTDGSSGYVYLYVFSTAGPLYVERAIVGAEPFPPSLFARIALSAVWYDESISIDDNLFDCPTVVPASPTGQPSFGDIMFSVPYVMVDPSGATHAVSAAHEMIFGLAYSGCTLTTNKNYPSGFPLEFEVTVLAPTASTVSICASETFGLGTCTS